MFALGVVLLALAVPAYAQQGLPARNQAEVRVNAGQGNASATPARIQTEQRFELRANVAKRKATNTSRVMMATTERLEQIAARIESRIAKVESAGGNASESRTALAEARNYLSLARTSIAAFASIDLSDNESLREKYDRVKAVAAEAKTRIREAHRSLTLAVLALRPGILINNAASAATSTNQ